MGIRGLLVCVCTFVAVVLFAGSVVAQQTAAPADAEITDDLVPEDTPPSCIEALKGCAGSGIADAFKTARQECKALRSCKKDCRGAKRDAKGEAKDEFKACVDACKGDKDCKKACKETKKAAKKDARADKRDCNSACRDEFKTEGCSAARKELAKLLGQCAAKAGGPCVQALQAMKAEEPPAE